MYECVHAAFKDGSAIVVLSEIDRQLSPGALSADCNSCLSPPCSRNELSDPKLCSFSAAVRHASCIALETRDRVLSLSEKALSASTPEL